MKAIIPGEISDIDFSSVVNIDRMTANDIISYLVKNGIGTWNGQLVTFAEEDKLKAAFFAITKGSPIEEVSEYLDWKDFEVLVSKILDENDFQVEQNVILTKPRMEIDVIGIKLNVAILIDCKHWKRMSNSALIEIVKKQVNRVKKYASRLTDVMVVPVIVTLHQEEVIFVNKVPIVPIMQLSSFLDELYGNLDQMKVIEK